MKINTMPDRVSCKALSGFFLTSIAIDQTHYPFPITHNLLTHWQISAITIA
ncbi:MAG: hypothetical protein ACD_62C00648G0002 [uncultured bacterium]|nr:MAG: hypothetical protein ACD_62C00648G0002 [uncultured bacterium]